MNRPIGYYVHHHGDGHRQRALAIARRSKDVVLIGSTLAERTGDVPFLDLPDDRVEDAFAGIDGAQRPSSLHYAPLDHEGIRRRTALIAAWIMDARPRLMIVDVSVEVAMLARLASVPTVYVRLSGRRIDAPHLDAFRGAMALLAPFPEALDDDETPGWIREKTFYAPAITGLPRSNASQSNGLVLVVLGRGGGISNGEMWATAARATPGRNWRIVGPCTVPANVPANLDLCGWVDDAEVQIANAAVVVGAAGDGVVGTVLASRRPFICLPGVRPFDEQISKARRLSAVGGAVVRYEMPQPGEWPALIDQAIDQAARWPAALGDNGGPEQVARWLEGIDASSPSERSRTA